MSNIETKIQQFKELSKKKKTINEMKQDIADILANTTKEEQTMIAEKLGKTKYEDIEHARNLQFIVPNIVKDRYEHNGQKWEFLISKKIKPTNISEKTEAANDVYNKSKIVINKKNVPKDIETTNDLRKKLEASKSRNDTIKTKKRKKISESWKIWIEKEKKVISLSSDKLEELIANILSNQSMVKKIEKMKIRWFDKEFDIDVNIWIKKFFQNIDIALTWKLRNTETSIAVVWHTIKANKFEEKVKKAMEDNVWTLDIKIKEYFEKKYKQDIEKIQIENGKLHIYFKA
jgi:hypothetical protein